MIITKENIEFICKAVCPNCASDAPLRKREDTQEWVHDFTRGPGTSHAFCLAHHFRIKYQDTLHG